MIAHWLQFLTAIKSVNSEQLTVIKADGGGFKPTTNAHHQLVQCNTAG